MNVIFRKRAWRLMLKTKRRGEGKIRAWRKQAKMKEELRKEGGLGS